MNPFFLWFRGSCNHDGRNKIATRLGGIEKLPFKVSLLNHIPSLVSARTADTRRLNPQLFAAQIQISIPKIYLGCGCKGLAFCRNNCWLMKNMGKVFIEQKWVLIVWPKIPQMPWNSLAQFVFPCPKVLNFNEKKAALCVRSPWVSALFRDHP